MILAKSIDDARANQIHRVSPDGRESWISRFFHATAEAPDTPMGFLVDKKAHAVIQPHFHEVNQFQVIVDGYGRLGKQEVRPFTLHYTNGYTGYGPITAEDEGISFFTLRNRFDPGAKYFSNSRHLMRSVPRRHRMPGPVALSDADTLRSRKHESLETVIEPEDDGLAAWFQRVVPGATTQAPDPARGGGQYIIVAGGTLLYNDAELLKLSCAYVSPDDAPMSLQAGPDGLEVLIAQFPVAETCSPECTEG